MFDQLNGHARGEIDVSIDKLASIILLARAYETARADGGGKEAQPGSHLASTHHIANEAAHDLRYAIDALSGDDRAVLLALSLIGRGDFGLEAFDQALTAAFDRRGRRGADFLFGLPGLADLLETGALACGADLGPDLRTSARPNGSFH